MSFLQTLKEVVVWEKDDDFFDTPLFPFSSSKSFVKAYVCSPFSDAVSDVVE